MTTTNLPRRAIIGTVLATALIGGGLVTAFAEDAPADGPCPTWTDPKGDSSVEGQGIPNTEDSNMDIVKASIGTVGDAIVGTITSDNLGEANSDLGDEFAISFQVAGVNIDLYADRANGVSGTATPAGISDGEAGFYNTDTDATGAATVVYDLKSKTVTITGKIAELAKAAEKSVAGQTLTGLTASSHSLVGVPGATTLTPIQYDDAVTKATYVVGADCAGGTAPAAAPVPSATPSAEPSAQPSPAPTGGTTPAASGDPLKDRPTAGCATFKDAKGDVSYNNTPNDPDLDMTEVAMRTTADAFVTYIKVDKLADKPSLTDGHRFYSEFTFNKHVFSIAASSFSSYGAQLRNGASQTGQAGPMSVMTVDSGGTGGDPGFTDAKVTSSFDVKTSTVVLSVPLAAIEKYGKAPVAGATFSAVQTRAGYDSGVLIFVGDTVKPEKAAEDIYVVGDKKCFAPPPPPLSNIGAVTAQYGDVAAVSAKLVDAAGAPVAGKTVTFAVGASKATGTTGADGIAKGALLVKEKAGKRALVLTSEGATVSVDFTVSVEKTALKAVGGKGGVTATLTDDDKKPVVGQVVTFTSGSKKVTAKTDAKGVAKATGLPAGNIKVAYAGATGMYAAASTTTKA